MPESDDARPPAATGSIRARRLALGWTQTELAAASGLKFASYVSMAERDHASAGVAGRVDAALTLEERRREWAAAEEVATRRHRTLAAAVPDGAEWRALQGAIADRAMELLDINRIEACDELLALLPEQEAGRLLSQWLDQQHPASDPEGNGHG